MLTKTIFKRSKLGNLQVFTKTVETCKSYLLQLLLRLDLWLCSIPVKRIMLSRVLTQLKRHVILLEVRGVSSIKLQGAAILGFVAVPFFYFFYLTQQYGGFGSTHVDFSKQITIPLVNWVYDNPLRQYVNWYWLDYWMGQRFGNVAFGVSCLIAFYYNIQSRFLVWIPIFYITLQLGIGLNQLYAPHGKYEITNLIFMALYSVIAFEFNRTSFNNWCQRIVKNRLYKSA